MKRNERKKRTCAGVLSLTLAAVMLLASLPWDMLQVRAAETTAQELRNPRVTADSSMTAKQKATWDCVWFGSYPQAEVVPSKADYTALSEGLLSDGDLIEDASLYSRLQGASGWDENNDITIGGNKYRRMKKSDATYSSSSSSYYQWPGAGTYRYFKYEPIKWRVLNVSGNQAFLLADRALDDQKYNTVCTDVTWETSTMRSWLNGYGASANGQETDYSGENFIGSAFTAAERAAIADTSVVNADNLTYGTEGGNDTADKVFLLSESEAYGEGAASHGFVANKSTYDEARRLKSSTYAKAMGTWSSTSDAYRGSCYWWLRSPGRSSIYAAHVLPDGWGYDNGYVCLVDGFTLGVCAALNLNLSSNQWSYAGTVCSDGTKDEEGGGGTSGGDSGEEDDGAVSVDSSQFTVTVRGYHELLGGELEGARVEIEGVGEALTDASGKARIANTLSEPSAMKRITVTKEGYRDYIFYTTLLSPQMVSVFKTNSFSVSLRKKEAGDDVNPYLSSMVYYWDGIAKNCGGQYFEKSDTVTFRACGIWNEKEPGYYCMYQNGQGGKTFESEDGIFRINIGKDFSGKGDIYVNMVAGDGTETKVEQVYIRFPEGSAASDDDSYVPLLNETGESGWQTDVPFLNNDKLSFDLGKLKTTIKRDGSKVKIILGAEKSGNIFKDEEWEEWKKFCESQPVDLSLSQWKDVLSSDNMTTSWTVGAKIKATGYGWLENDLSADSQTPLAGGIQVVIDASTSFKQQYVVGVIPVYMEESLGASGELEGNVTFDTGTRKFGGSVGITVTPSLSVGGGVGVLYVATVGAEGSASMPMKIDFPKGLTQADLNGALSLKASVLGFSYSKTMAEGTYPLYKAEESKSAKKGYLSSGADLSDTAAMYDMGQYALPDGRAAKTQWYGEQRSRAKKIAAAKSNLSERLLQSGTSDLTEPMLVQEGDTTLAVFLTEDSSREIIHRTKLVYTVYDEGSGTWSSPAVVDEDGTGDFQPYLSASNGQIAVSWLNYAEGMVTDASSMKEALQAGEICCARWDKETQSFTRVSGTMRSSADVSYNSAHPYVDGQGNITQAGLKNTAVDIFGTSGDNILFMSGTFENADINREFTLSQGTPVSYDVSASQGAVTAAVCMDTDRDLTTLEDREIYLFSSDGDVRRLTNDNTYDSAPQYASYQGESALYWYTENGIQVMKDSGEQIAVSEKENTEISENFTVVNGANKETAIVWSEVDENNVYQLTASLYDAESGKWSRQVVLSDSQENIFRPSGYFNADGDMEFIYRKGSTISPGELYALQVAPAPDLEIVDAYIEDGGEIPGKTAKVSIGVRNIGTQKITQYTADVNGETTQGTTELLPGESILLEAGYTVPETVENRKVTVGVSVDGDRDVSNNTFQLTAGYADFSAAVSEDEYENGKIVYAAVTNTEAVAAEAVLEVHKDTADGELVSTESLGTLKQGDIVSKDFVYQRGSEGYDVDANALYYVVTSSAAEKYESNNYGYSVFREKEDSGQGSGNQPEEKPEEKPEVKPEQKPGVKPLAPAGTAVKVKKITLSGISKKIAAGKKIKLTAKISPSNAQNKAVQWKSSNTKVATVNASGVVSMKKGSGGKKVTITATAKDGSGIKASYKITSMKGVVKKVTISGKKTVKAGKSLKLEAKVKATKKANRKLKWTSSNKKYAKVNSSGKVKTYKAGKGKKVKITAAATDGSGKKKTVTIKIR